MSKKFFLGTLFGATIGAATALLTAQKTGKELREELADKAEDVKAVTLDYVELATVKGQELTESTLKSSEKWRQDLVEKSSQLVQTVKDSANEFAKNLNTKETADEDTLMVGDQVSEPTEEVVEVSKEVVESQQ